MGLSLPWLLYNGLNGHGIKLNSISIFHSLAFAMASSAGLILTIAITKLKLDKRIAILPTCIYIAYVATILIDTNGLRTQKTQI